MGFVACLRFGDHGGAILGDEESWHLRRTKTYINDPVHALVDPKDAEARGIDLVYAGAGTTGYHKMVVEAARGKIAEAFRKGGKKGPTLLSLARLVNEAMAEVHRFWRDNRLKLYFDLSIDDVIRGAGRADGKPFEIGADEVKKKAKKIIATNEDGGYHNKNHALVIGYDGRGFNMFCLKGEIGVLSYVSTGFDVLGRGVYGSGAKFRERLENMTLKNRRAGMDRATGILTLLSGALGASEYYNEAGGNFPFTVIDRSEKPDRRRIECRDERSRLAREIAWAEMNGLVATADAKALLDRLVFSGAGIDEIDEALFARSTDADLLDRLLRGYKIDEELRSLVRGQAAPPPGKRPARGRKPAARKGAR